MRVYRAPKRWNAEGHEVVVFLSGSVPDTPRASWRDRVIEALSGFDDSVIVLNPVRDDWGDDWGDSAECDEFREQTEWELQGLERADVVAVHFSAASYSPITLLEYGLVAWDQDKSGICVHCEQGFWRRGNIEVVARRYAHEWCEDWDAFIRSIVRATAWACEVADSTWHIGRTSGVTRQILLDEEE